VTQKNSQKGGEEQAPKPDFASCCREMAAEMTDDGPAMERMISACGPMMRRMMAACCERSDRSESADEDPAPAGG
jgi:hypothetical protein